MAFRLAPEKTPVRREGRRIGGGGGGGREEMTGRGGETVCKRGCRERVASLGCLWVFFPPLPDTRVS